MSRRPIDRLTPFSLGQIRNSEIFAKRQVSKAEPAHTGWSLGIASVAEVNYEELSIQLKVLTGEGDVSLQPLIPITFPGAGRRHFLGSMPQVGDTCVVGWMYQSSENPKAGRIPVILGWLVDGVWAGRLWQTIGGFSPEEVDLALAKNANLTRGNFDRVRHKLRHIQPGNIVASSAQGSDLVLDESAALANRRGNEIRLRDQDQSVVTRALQRFDALAGVRAYHGMVQRDSRTLPPTALTDGLDWQAAQPEEIEGAPPGKYNPNEVFKTIPGVFQANSDPTKFLSADGLISPKGFGVNLLDSQLYGGKPIYRVAVEGGAAESAQTETLTEYRIELSHTSKGRLPVTEQTDGYDADGFSEKPYLEWVIGSVVGNNPKDPYSYAKPLTFSSDFQVTPATEGVPLDQHAAALFRMTPISGEIPQTFWGMNKAGQFRAAIGGTKGGDSIAVKSHGSAFFDIEGDLKLDLKGQILIRNKGIGFESNLGPASLYGETAATIESQETVTLKGSATHIDSPILLAQTTSTSIAASNSVDITSGGKIVYSAAAIESICTGKMTQTFAGPKNMLPTSGALHEQTYVPAYPGFTTKKSTIVFGDNEENILLGNHKTSILIGNATYETNLGILNLRAATSNVSLHPGGIEATALVGNITLVAPTGAATLMGLASASVIATAGVATVSGTAGIIMRAPPTEIGSVLVSGSLEPFTGLPYITWLMGAKGVNVLP